MKKTRKPSIINCVICLGLVGVYGTGCAGNSQELYQAEIAALQERISDLERGSGRSYARMEGLEQDVLLLEDRVEAHTLSLERRGVTARRTRSELPRYQAPPVAASRGPIEQLPVQRLTPGDTSHPIDELVITNETLRDFVEHNGGSAPPIDNRLDSPTRAQRPLAPVVLNDSLPPSESQTPRTVSLTAEPSGPRGVDLYQASLRQFNQGEYSQAMAGFQNFLSSGPAEDYQDNATYWIGECHYASGEYAQALQVFEQVVRDYPNGNKVPDSLLKIGLTYERLNNQREANEVLSVLVETYPTTDAARRASERLTELN